MKFKKKYLFIELRNNWIVFGNNGNDIIEKYENIFRDIYLYRNCKYYLVLKIIKGKNGCLYSGYDVEMYSREEKI